MTLLDVYPPPLCFVADEEAEAEAVAMDPSALEARAPLPFEDFELTYGQNSHVDAVCSPRSHAWNPSART